MIPFKEDMVYLKKIWFLIWEVWSLLKRKWSLIHF